MTENHFVKVFRSPKDKFKFEFEKKQRKNNKHPPSRRSDTVHQFSQGNGASATYSDDDDDYVVHSFSAFALHDDVEDDKYFTWLPVSVSPEKSIKVFMRVDSAAYCNNLPSSVFRKISSLAPLKPSHVRIFPYPREANSSVG